ncbi:drug/metabolite transporter (DMT)-like permease [Paenibacillus castaneae]|uniref:hypothetical protein n=1 Tax=Paenibacillus castaneae TaxID=474957 RepID=UPI000C9B6336|nr:hypothetical protein [Paenibacillus castaneae]NIK77310.1 drug/metabolite transporter (DMT)-like permease [Paenibacillus castaneae]
MDSTATIIFIIAAFALGALVILKRDTMPPRLRRFFAISAIAFIAFSFFLIVYAFFTMGAE